MSPSIKSTIGFSRRFLNLIVGNRLPGVKSLCCFDLMHQQLFYPATPPPAQNVDECKQKIIQPATMMESMGLPLSSINFGASALIDQSKIDCFPLAGREMICTDQSGRAFHLNADTCQAWTMPSLYKPKSMPLALFVPNADADNDYDHDGYGSSLFVMERIPKPELGFNTEHRDQFEAFIYRKPTISSYIKAWHCHQLPPPPFACEPKYWHSCSSPEISSYAVLGGGSHICLSVNGISTYCLETACHTWSEVSKWTLPFHGRIDYVPEFNLWFGFSAEARHLAAADLSAMDSQPQLVGPWKELNLPEEWRECKDPQLVNLGLGRFCIVRFFRTRVYNSDFGDEPIAVFTGVEVVPHVGNANKGSNGKVQLQMIPHRSKCHTSNATSIDAVF